MSRNKIIIGAIGGAVLIGAGVIFLPALMRTGNAAADIDTIPKVTIHGVGADGVTIRIDLQTKNPTKADFKMKYPYFRLVYKGDTIGTSQSIDQDIGMPHLGEANFNNIQIKIPLLSVLTSAGSLVKAALAKQEINLNVEVLTHIDPYWKYNADTKQWKRLPNLGKTSLIDVSKSIPITLNKKQG